jgi:hypothetical protein
MKFLFRWAFRLLMLALVLAIGLALLKDTLVREAAVKALKRETGLEVRIGKMQVGLFNSTVSMENLVLYNPAEFGGSPLFDIPDLYAEYSWNDAMRDKLRFRMLRIHVREMNVVDNQHGQNNFAGVVGRLKQAPATGGAAGGSGGGDGLKFDRIEVLNLSVNKVRYSNMRFPKRDNETDLRIKNEIIQNLKSPQDVAGVLLKVLLRAGITVYHDQPVTNRARVL